MALSCLFVASSIFAFVITNAGSYSYDGMDDEIGPFVSRIASANRGSGEGLLIESENELSQILLTLPANAEPMYISAAPLTNEFYIGDRTNKQLIVYDTTTLQQLEIISTNCSGIFHQFYNFRNQLWVVCDEDNTILVIDTETRTEITTITIENVPTGYKPHDITTSTRFAYVTLLGGAGNGSVIQYSTRSFKERRRITVGPDPHVFINPFEDRPDFLFIAAQGSSEVYKVDSKKMTIEDILSVNGAHGIWGNSDYIYVTDITSMDGNNSLYVIDTSDFSFRAYDAQIGAPHNVMINSAGDKLFITHSGPGAVTVYDIAADGGLDDVNARTLFQEDGSVPFGIMNLISLSEYNLLTSADADDAVIIAEEQDISTHALTQTEGDNEGFVGKYLQWMLVAVGVVIFVGLIVGYCVVTRKAKKSDSKDGHKQVINVEMTEV